MKNMLLARLALLFSLATLVLTGCAAGSKDNGAPQAVESYLQALVSGDADGVANLSCAAWEADAQVEVDSFAAVVARLENPACKVTGTDGDTTLVSCSGKIVANYNGEDQDINLDERTYQVVQEGGEWRMCGYR